MCIRDRLQDELNKQVDRIFEIENSMKTNISSLEVSIKNSIK